MTEHDDDTMIISGSEPLKQLASAGPRIEQGYVVEGIEVSLYDDQERRALAVERAAWALTSRVANQIPDCGEVLHVAEYMISGAILGRTGPNSAG